MIPEPIEITGRIAVDQTDAHAVVKNAATNGRLIVCMLFIANLAAFYRGNGVDHWHLAILCAAIVGASSIADRITNDRIRSFVSVGVITVTAVVTILSFIIL